jgi:FlaA1/EpsC-like NDP-sugar epimerase
MGNTRWGRHVEILYKQNSFVIHISIFSLFEKSASLAKQVSRGRVPGKLIAVVYINKGHLSCSTALSSVHIHSFYSLVFSTMHELQSFVFLYYLLVTCAAGFQRPVGNSMALSGPQEINSSYDFVIIGGGTSGLTVADRLPKTENVSEVLF